MRFIIAFLIWLMAGPALAQQNQPPCNPSAGANPGATQLRQTGSWTGTAGLTLTLPATAGQMTYACGFIITSGAIAASQAVSVTLGPLAQNATDSYAYLDPQSGQGLLGAVAAPFCWPANAINTPIVLTIPSTAAHTGGAVLWGCRQ